MVHHVEQLEQPNCCTRRRGCLRMVNVCAVLIFVIFIVLQHNDADASMLVVYGIAAVLTILAEFPYSRIKQIFWVRSCVLFFLGCLIAAIVRSGYKDTWEPFDFDGNAADVLGLYLVSFWIFAIVIMERWGVNGIYHNRANYDTEELEIKDDQGAATVDLSASASSSTTMAQV